MCMESMYVWKDRLSLFQYCFAGIVWINADPSKYTTISMLLEKRRAQRGMLVIYSLINTRSSIYCRIYRAFIVSVLFIVPDSRL